MSTKSEALATVTQPHESDETLPRGADEIDFLDSRQKSMPLKAATLREKLKGVTAPARRRVPFDGRQAHAEGTELVELYMRHADAVLGYPSFRQLLLENWAPGLDDAYRRMRIAKFCTEDQATLGVTKCDRGIRLMKRLEKKSFEDLLEPPLILRLPAKASRPQTTFFDATPDEVLWTIEELERLARPQPDETLGEAVFHTRGTVRDMIDDEPRYEELHPTVSAGEKDVVVRTSPSGRDGFALAAKFYASLARRR